MSEVGLPPIHRTQRSINQPIHSNNQSSIQHDPLASFAEMLATLPPVPPAHSASTPASLINQSISQILDQTVRDLDLILSINPSIIDDQSLNQQTSLELIIALKEHFHLEDTNQSIVQSIQQANQSQLASPNGTTTFTIEDQPINQTIKTPLITSSRTLTSANSTQKVIQPINQPVNQIINQSNNHSAAQSQSDLERCLIDSSLSVLRLIHDNPHIAERLEFMANQSFNQPANQSIYQTINTSSLPDNVVQFRSVFHELLTLLPHRLALSAAEVDAQSELSATLAARAEHDIQARADLLDKQAAARAAHNQSISHVNSLRARYSQQLQSMIEHVEESQLSFDRAVKNEEEKNDTIYQSKFSSYSSQLADLQTAFNNATEDAWRVESQLQRKIALKHAEINQTCSDYDREMFAAQDKCEALEDLSKREQAEISRLTAYFTAKAQLDDKLAAERTLVRQKRDEQVKAMRQQAEFISLVEEAFENWCVKTGVTMPGINMKPKKDTKKKYKVMWRPPKVTVSVAASKMQSPIMSPTARAAMSPTLGSARVMNE